VKLHRLFVAVSLIGACVAIGINEPRAQAITVGSGSCVQIVNAVAGVQVSATETSCLVKFTQPGPNTWTPPTGVSSVKLLVVGGGGGGGKDGGGGGGGGGVYESLSHAATAGTAVNITVGGGGLGAICYLDCGSWSADVQGENGSNGIASSFGAITAGGGGTARNGSNDPLFEFSADAFGAGGGGGSRNTNGTTGWPTQTVDQTIFAGGIGCNDMCNGGDSVSIGRGGGGGGAAPAYGTSSELNSALGSSGGGGASGRSCALSWCGTTVFGSGGGGGAYDSSAVSLGGSGAGNGGTNESCATVGTANTGGGGGGGGNGNLCSVGAGAAGGSGVVIISYDIPVDTAITTPLVNSPTTVAATTIPVASAPTPSLVTRTTLAADTKKTTITATETPLVLEVNQTDPTKPITTADGSVIELSPGEALALIGGREVNVVKAINSRNVTLDLGSVDVAIGAKGPFGLPSWPTGEGNLAVPAGRSILLKGSGLRPGSRITVFMFSRPIKLGEIEVDENGEFDGSVNVPRTSEDGEHTLQVNGQLSNGNSVSSNLGFEIEDEEDRKIESEVAAALEKCNGEDDYRACSIEVGDALGTQAEKLEKTGNSNDKSRARKLRNRLEKYKKALEVERKADRDRREVEAGLPANSTREMVTICHATGSSSNPYVNIVVSSASLKAGNHAGHIDDIIPQLKGINGVNWPGKKTIYIDLCGGYVEVLSTQITTSTTSTSSTTTTTVPRTTSTTSTSSATTMTVPRSTSTTLTTSTTTTTAPRTTTSLSLVPVSPTSTSTSTSTTTSPSTSIVPSTTLDVNSTSTSAIVTTTEALVRAQIIDVLDIVDEYIDESKKLHDDVIEDTARQLDPEPENKTSTTIAIPSAISTVTATSLRKKIEQVRTTVEVLTPETNPRERATVLKLANQMEVLHEANVQLLSEEDANDSSLWVILVLLVAFGIGGIIVWRRRWVSIDLEACTACGTCTSLAPEFFVADAVDARAYVVERDSNDVPEFRHRIRLPKSRRSRKLVREMVKACETDAIKVTIRRRFDDPRV
jgi:ferredoxin